MTKDRGLKTSDTRLLAIAEVGGLASGVMLLVVGNKSSEVLSPMSSLSLAS